MAESPGPHLDRAQLAELQTLFVRLLFCQNTLSDYTRDAASVLEDQGLPAEARSLLPDPTSDSFLAEARGRRLRVVRDVSNQFERTAAYFETLKEAPQPGVPPLSFDAFLASDHFLDPMKSLPHPHGVGPGFESTSKFYFWMREAYGTARPGADVALRTALNLDFAAYLMRLRERPCHPYYDRFTGGVCWSETPGTAAPAYLLSDQLVLAKVASPEKVREILRIGIVDLDTVAPEPWELEPSI